MLTEKELENLLSRSPVAQDFFRQAQLGLVDNNLYYNTEVNQIFSRSLERLPRTTRSEQLIFRILIPRSTLETA